MGVTLTPIGKTVLSEEALRSLREAIVFGIYRPGERLVEREIAQKLGVSQGPVREAFRKLESEGLIHTYPHQGTYVVSFNRLDILQILQVRNALERLAARIILQKNKNTEDLAPLRRYLQEMIRAAANNDPQQHVNIDFTFHRTLCELSGNRRLIDMWMLMAGQIRLTLYIETQYSHVSLPERADSHHILLDALQQRDLAAVEHFFDFAFDLWTSWLDHFGDVMVDIAHSNSR